jgi:hypothetical protein
MCEYIYLIHTREFYNLNKNIYKIGKTKQENLKRFNNYPKGSKLLFQIICNNCDLAEKELLKIFKLKYNLESYIGLEYFSGNYISMIQDIYNYLYKDINITNNDDKNNYDKNNDDKNNDDKNNDDKNNDDKNNDDKNNDNKNNDDKNNDDKNNDDKNDKTEIIDTYEKLLKYTNIKSIRIIDKDKIEGYLMLKDIDSEFYFSNKNEDCSSLILWLEWIQKKSKLKLNLSNLISKLTH